MVRRAGGRQATKNGKPSKAKMASEARADRQFMRVMQDTYESKQARDIRVCHEMIDSNPAWVPWLAQLFENGRMSRFIENQKREMEKEDDVPDDEDFGSVINSRVKRITKLKLSEKHELLGALRKVPALEDVDDES